MFIIMKLYQIIMKTSLQTPNEPINIKLRTGVFIVISNR